MLCVVYVVYVVHAVYVVYVLFVVHVVYVVYAVYVVFVVSVVYVVYVVYVVHVVNGSLLDRPLKHSSSPHFLKVTPNMVYRFPAPLCHDALRCCRFWHSSHPHERKETPSMPSTIRVYHHSSLLGRRPIAVRGWCA